MERSLQTRVSVVLLALFTAAAIVFAILNFNQENNFQTPTDGVWWVEAQNGLQAQRVISNGPGQRAGIKTGDLLLSANGVPTVRWATRPESKRDSQEHGTKEQNESVLLSR